MNAPLEAVAPADATATRTLVVESGPARERIEALERLCPERREPFGRRFRLVALLGGGSQGRVYLCRDLHRPAHRVAVKLSRASSEAREALARETSALWKLARSGAVPKIEALLYRRGRLCGFGTEYLLGETLGRLLGHGPLPRARADRLAVSVSGAVIRVLRGGILHRDLKPENVLVTGNDGLRILDFGLSCPIGQNAGRGEVSGTFAYASPEQLSARVVGPRSDLFSLGLILYEIATGEMFFSRDAPDLRAFVRQRERRMKRPLDLEGVSAPLASLIRRLVVSDPERRADLEEVEARLRRLPRAA